MRTEIYRITGIDLTAIPSIQAPTVYTVFSEIGRDVSRFPSAKHFASWLGLCPDSRITGGKILSAKTRLVHNRAALALPLAAQNLTHSHSALGDYYRRLRAKFGAPKAVTAAARKLARLIYHLLKTRQPFDLTRFAHHEELYRRRSEVRLHLQAKALGFALIPL